MKPEEFTAKTQEIAQNLADPAKVTTILAELIEDYNKEAVVTATATASALKLTEDNEKLRAANMSLFLKVGEAPKPDNKPKPEDTTLKFEALFDDKGNLK